MSYTTKNKILIGVLIVLLLANIATISVFWISKGRRPPMPKEPPTEYLVNELKFDSLQKIKYLALVQEHRKAADSLRQETRNAKDNFFKLLQQAQVTDTEKTTALEKISHVSEQLDLVTFEHFKKVRSLCNIDQQKKFDTIIQDVMRMAGGQDQQGAAGAPGHPPPPGPPHEDREGRFPPPGNGNRPPPPRGERPPPPH